MTFAYDACLLWVGFGYVFDIVFVCDLFVYYLCFDLNTVFVYVGYCWCFVRLCFLCCLIVLIRLVCVYLLVVDKLWLGVLIGCWFIALCWFCFVLSILGLLLVALDLVVQFLLVLDWLDCLGLLTGWLWLMCVLLLIGVWWKFGFLFVVVFVCVLVGC